MPRKKLIHFAEMKDWPHVHEPEMHESQDAVVDWGEKVMVELGCGQGQYTIGLAERFPGSTVVGVDIKGARIWHGAKAALDQKLENAHFLRARIEDLYRFFKPRSIDTIWVTFPDPHPREGKAKKRLTSARFLKMYRELLKEGGTVRLKTDVQFLIDFTEEVAVEEGWQVLHRIDDVHGEGTRFESDEQKALLREVRTQYESRYVEEGKPIYYLEMGL